jgi:hypothetical protein
MNTTAKRVIAGLAAICLAAGAMALPQIYNSTNPLSGISVSAANDLTDAQIIEALSSVTSATATSIAVDPYYTIALPGLASGYSLISYGTPSLTPAPNMVAPGGAGYEEAQGVWLTALQNNEYKISGTIDLVLGKEGSNNTTVTIAFETESLEAIMSEVSAGRETWISQEIDITATYTTDLGTEITFGGSLTMANGAISTDYTLTLDDGQYSDPRSTVNTLSALSVNSTALDAAAVAATESNGFPYEVPYGTTELVVVATPTDITKSLAIGGGYQDMDWTDGNVYETTTGWNNFASADWSAPGSTITNTVPIDSRGVQLNIQVTSENGLMKQYLVNVTIGDEPDDPIIDDDPGTNNTPSNNNPADTGSSYVSYPTTGSGSSDTGSTGDDTSSTSGGVTSGSSGGANATVDTTAGTAEVTVGGTKIETSSTAAAQTIASGSAAEVVTSGSAVAVVTKSGDVVAGANVSGSMNSTATIAALEKAAETAVAEAAEGETPTVTIKTGTDVNLISDATVEKLAAAAEEAGVTLKIQSAATDENGENVGAIVVPVSETSTKGVKTGIVLDAPAIDTAVEELTELTGNAIIGAFQTEQTGSFGAKVTIAVKTEALGIDLEDGTVLYAAIKTADGKIYQVKCVVYNGAINFKTTRAGVVMFSTDSFVG